MIGCRLTLCRSVTVCTVNSQTSSSSNINQRRNITSKALRIEEGEKTIPWPYREKGYTPFQSVFDFTKHRLGENSKLIVFEGNIGSGKGKIAREVAEQLGFHYIPPFSPDFYLITRYGQDLRDYYDQFPEPFRYPDFKMFYEDPFHKNVFKFQWRMFIGRMEQYLNACAHILNTGQGVVLDRSLHSDFVFANAMRQKKFISKEAFRYYHLVRKSAIAEAYFRPHLVVYIDVPVNTCMDNIRKRGIAHENNGKVLDEEYLTSVQESYKDMIEDANPHSRVFIYDEKAVNYGSDLVVEDIESHDFDFHEWHGADLLFKTWVTLGKPGVHINDLRMAVTEKHTILNELFFARSYVEVEELYTNAADRRHWHHVMMHKVYKSPYKPGYILNRGDSLWDMIKGQKFFRWRSGPREPWVEYWVPEVEYESTRGSRFKTIMDEHGEDWDPRYLEKHH